MARIDRYVYNNMKDRADRLQVDRMAVDTEFNNEYQRLEKLSKEITGMSATDYAVMQEKFDIAKQNLLQELETFREEFGRHLGRQALENRRAIESVRSLAEQNKRDLADVTAQISNLEEKINAQIAETARRIENDRKQAVYYYDQLCGMVEEISKLFPQKYEQLFPEKLHPGHFILKTTIGYIAEDIAGKHYEAAIGLAQAGLREAINVLTLLEYYHSEFLNIQSETSRCLDELVLRVEKIESPKIMTVEVCRVEYTDTNGIMYWARELYEEPRKRFVFLRENFEKANEAHNSAVLSRLLHEIKELDEQITFCEKVEDAERRLHYDCVETASKIFDILNENDNGKWRVEHFDDKDDLREPVCMTFRNLDGSILTLACIPDRNDDLTVQGRVRCALDAFDKDSEKYDITSSNILYNHIVTVLTSNGISVEEKRLNIDSPVTFVHSAMIEEKEKRLRLIFDTKNRIGIAGGE